MFGSLGLLPGCVDGGTTSADAGTESTTEAETDDASSDGSSSDATTGSGSETDVGTTAEPVPVEPIHARGLLVTDVLADQGVSVPIGMGGLPVGGADRNAYLVANRSTLIRAFVDIVEDDSWVAREIEARITLNYDDGTSESAKKVLLIERDSVINNWDSTFFWYIPPELIRAGMSFSIELFELDQALVDTPEPSPPPLFPTEGIAYVGIEDSYGALDIALVPVQHDLNGKTCGPPEFDDAFLERMHNDLMAQNPVERVDITVLEPFVFTQGMKSFGPLLSALSQLRGDYDAPPQQYFYGLVIPCDGGAEGVGGQAFGIPQGATKSNAYQRVAMGRFYGSDSSTASTFTHEIGHTQGRYHIACSGSEGGTDDSYPYPGGTTGVYGFDIFYWNLHTPNQKDYMTYCGPTWVSDWAWNKVHPVIQALSAWEGEGDVAPPSGTLLVGALYDDGSEEWWTTPGNLEGERLSTIHALEFKTAEGVVRAPASYNQRPDDTTINVVVELPTSLDEITAATRLSDAGAHPIALPTIKRLARR
ncbi:MAG: hypothetical protein KC636_27195 [Myxococcales bacterium]|nr:hypothetical protein [Myxococcales bacterium]